MSKKKKVLIIICIAVIAFAAVFAAYVNDYYHALPEAVEIAHQMMDEGGNLYLSGDKTTGFIIYPGGKVDEKAYAPLAKEINDLGYPVIIAKMPLRLAIFNTGKAGNIIENHQEVASWVLVGHSLGGTAASMYVAGRPEKIKGIVFLGSYPYKDLSGTGISALAITGSEDLVLNREKAGESSAYYPADYKSVIIEGGNHAYFGCYGEQNGDGHARITNMQQIAMTVSQIEEFFNK